MNLLLLTLFTLSRDVVKWRMFQQKIVNIEWQKLMHDDNPVANLGVPRDGMTTMIMRRWLSTRVGARLTTSVSKRFPVMRHNLTPGHHSNHIISISFIQIVIIIIIKSIAYHKSCSIIVYNCIICIIVYNCIFGKITLYWNRRDGFWYFYQLLIKISI